MEKLEPLLRYKFWISFGVALLCPAIGWMMVSGSLVEKVDTDKKTVETKFADATDHKNKASTYANASYKKGLDEITQSRRGLFGDAHVKLRQAQIERMVWPPAVAEDMVKYKYLEPPKEIKTLVLYGSSYDLELERVRNIVSPYNFEEQIGLVDMPIEVLPRANTGEWKGTGPRGEVMWEAQEDIWLLTAILEAVARVNENATSIVDAPIKSVQELTLRGGSRQKAQKAARAAARKPAGEESAAPARGREPDEGGKGGARDVAFVPAEEFGEEKIANPKAVKKDADDDDSGRKGRAKRKKEDDPAGGVPAELVKRYIDGDATTQYKTRGFYIQVAMKNTFIPSLVAELSNMPYPTEIVRVQYSDTVDIKFQVKGRVEQSAPAPQASAAKPAGPVAMGGSSMKPSFKGGFSKGAAEKEKSREEKKSAAEKKKMINQKGRMTTPGSEGLEMDLLQAAGRDPYLATVVIAGTMTIYQQDLDPKTAKPRPSTKLQVEAGAPVEAPEQPPAEEPEKAPTQPAAQTGDKSKTEKKAPDKPTNGK